MRNFPQFRKVLVRGSHPSKTAKGGAASVIVSWESRERLGQPPRYTQTADFDEQLTQARSNTTSYYDPDGIGSITSLTNSTGVLANTYIYDSFGKATASTGTITNSFRYTGREFDFETGLYYDRARYYDPVSGRFVAGDPIGFDGGPNFYRYALNDPTTLDDPTGLNPLVGALPWLGGLGGEGVGAAAAAGAGAGIAVVGAGAAGWGIGRGIGHIPIGNDQTVDDAVTNGFTNILIYFAKGRKQNISNEYVDEAKNMFGDNRDKICRWLDGLYAVSGPAARQKIIKAQKYFGCRRCGGGGN